MLRLWVLELAVVICCVGCVVSTNWKLKKPSNVNDADLNRICSAKGCACGGIAVKCYFSETFELNHKCPNLNITSFTIILSNEARLIVRKDFFYTNQVKILHVTGGKHVELTSSNETYNHSLRHPGAVNLESRAFRLLFRINVDSVKTLHVNNHTFNGTTFHVNFSRVDNLRFDEEALHGAKLDSSLYVKDSLVNGSLKMRINDIQFVGTTIDRIQANAFKVKNGVILFDGCSIGVFEANAIRTRNLQTFTLQNNIIHRIAKKAIVASVSQLKIINNHIEHAEDLWLSLNTWSNVAISTNSFGHFEQFHLAGDHANKVCTFHNNEISDANFNYPQCASIKNITIKHCPCNQSWPRYLVGSPDDRLMHEINCLLDDIGRFCYNSTHLAARSYKMLVCNESEQYKACKNHTLMRVAMITASVVALTVLLMIALIVVCRHSQKSESAVPVALQTNTHSTFTIDDGVTTMYAGDNGNENVYAEPLKNIQRYSLLNEYSAREETENYAEYAQPHQGPAYANASIAKSAPSIPANVLPHPIYDLND